jgi:hypothetical protein
MDDVIFNGTLAQAKIISAIQNAQNLIKIAVYLFTDVAIADALEEAIDRGINVKLVLSGKELNEGIVTRFKDKCLVCIDDRNGKWGDMHHKFCIIDDNLLLSGSYNYTVNAQKNNNEDLRITDNNDLLKKYITEFDDLLEQVGSKSPSKDRSNLTDSKEVTLGSLPSNNSTQLPNISAANRIENFSQQMKNLISIAFADYDPVQQEQDAFQLSERNQGSLPIFRTMLDGILAKVRNKISGDTGTRTNLLVQINNFYELTKLDLEDEFEGQTKFTKEINLGKSNQINKNIDEAKKEINQKKAEKIEKEGSINELRNEINILQESNFRLDQEIVVEPLCSAANWLKFILVSILVFYLSLFFASAIWKIFFEEAYIFSLLDQGISPKKPLIFDIDALSKIYSLKGLLAALVSTFFFLIPLLLSNLQLFAPKLKGVKWYELILGLFFIDIVVSFLVSQYTFRINALLIGEESNWNMWHAISSGEFWMIFIFGALPLFIAKSLIENLNIAYQNSNPNSVNREKNMERVRNLNSIKSKESTINSYNTGINLLNFEIEKLGIHIKLENEKIIEIQTNERLDLENRHNRLKDTIQGITTVKQNFISYLSAGSPILIGDIIDGPIAAASSGYYSFINSYFAPEVARGKIEDLNKIKQNWFAENFTGKILIK